MGQKLTKQVLRDLMQFLTEAELGRKGISARKAGSLQIFSSLIAWVRGLK